MTRPATVAAVDLGASSGRVMRARVGADVLDLTEVGRFANVPVHAGQTLSWDAPAIFANVLDGLRAAGPVDSIGVDAWGVDYGLFDEDGRLLENPVHYRDRRTEGVLARLLDEISPTDLYTTTGVQLLPINTIVQLVAARDTDALAAAHTLLLIPDVMTYWLTGAIGAERTNASTTQLMDIRTGSWATDLIARLGIRPGLLPPLRSPGSTVGGLRPDIAGRLGFDAAVPVTAVASHDTASAVVGVPATSRRFAYVSCGTWSLVGVELDHPVLTDESRAANFTNEVGVDGTIRYLRNVMGLWLLQECVRTWQEAGYPMDVPDLLADATRAPGFAAIVDANDPAFLPPGDMPARIAAACTRTGQPPPAGPAETVRCIVDSLALAHRDAVADAQRLAGYDIDVVHIVGGGARNALLCQLTADACGYPVEAGPQEATAVGNVLVQARSLGRVGPDLTALRALVRATVPVTRYEPSGNPRAWAVAAARLAGASHA